LQKIRKEKNKLKKNNEINLRFVENIMTLTSKLEKENKELYEIIKILVWWERLKNFLAPEYFFSARFSGTQIQFRKIENLENEIKRLNFYIFQFNQLFSFRFPEIKINEILGVKMSKK
jgi:hypothetical protein